jgi:hypothetical protein
MIGRGDVPAGWALAYGIHADFAGNNLIRISRMKRVSGVEYSVAIEMLSEQIKLIKSKIAEVKEVAA